ncbi:MAG: hypothetical protein R3305_08800 [Gammaproteobacteria bacterium]|nr:hypothetical protein [Gammaproteobacteria bacterium]
MLTLAAAFGVAAHAQDAANDRALAVDDLAPAVDTSRSLRNPVAPAAPAAPAPQAAPVARSAPAVIDRLDLGTTSITGNQELPKVLYIVPWKRSDLGDLIGRPVNTLLDEVLAPVDPEVFERHLSYYETLHGESQEE